MNYNDAACAIECYNGHMCSTGTCYCENQDPFLLLPSATYQGYCAGSTFDDWQGSSAC